MKSQRLRFKNPLGIELGARLDRPDTGPPAAYAVFAHCFTCNKDYKFLRQVSHALTGYGIAVLCPDFTGLGESGGRFEDSNFGTSVADVMAAARFLADVHQPPTLLIGHSLGGTAVLAAAPDLPCVRAVATLNAPFEPEHIFHHFKEIEDQVDNVGEAEAVIGGKTYRITRQLLHDLRTRRMEDAIGRLDAALLVLHAPRDETVGIDNAGRIFQAARHPKSFIALDGADHLLSREADARYAGQLIAAWAARYFTRGAGADPAPVPPPGTVTAAIGGENYAVTIEAGGHRLVADEPEAAGGGNRGPAPHDLLAASLGACTCITLQMYAGRKGWPLEGVAVKLKYTKAGDDDRGGTPDSPGRMECEIDLAGPLDGEQRRRLLEIADRCPVHRTLRGCMLIETRLKGAPAL